MPEPNRTTIMPQRPMFEVSSAPEAERVVYSNEASPRDFSTEDQASRANAEPYLSSGPAPLADATPKGHLAQAEPTASQRTRATRFDGAGAPAADNHATSVLCVPPETLSTGQYGIEIPTSGAGVPEADSHVLSISESPRAETCVDQLSHVPPGGVVDAPREANLSLDPNASLPRATPRRGRSSSATRTRTVASAAGHMLTDPQLSGAGGSSFGDRQGSDTQRRTVADADRGQSGSEPQPLAATVGALIEMHRRRVDLHRAEKRLTLQIKAICRRLLMGSGVPWEKAKEASEPLYAAVMGKGEHALLNTALVHLQPFLAARQPLETNRKAIEKQLVALAKDLPIWPWWEAIKGVSALSLASLVGEAGDLGKYGNPAKLWKRMGVGLVKNDNGTETAQGRPGEHATKADWVRHGYNASRRSVLWNIGAGMLRAQKKGNGVFYALYAARRLHEEPKCTKPIEVHRRAQRFMEKRFLREAWKAWRRMAIIRSMSETVLPEAVTPDSPTLRPRR